MNRYQRQRHKEILALQKVSRIHLTYKKARRSWDLTKRIKGRSPCEECKNSSCKGPYNIIAYCAHAYEMGI